MSIHERKIFGAVVNATWCRRNDDTIRTLGSMSYLQNFDGYFTMGASENWAGGIEGSNIVGEYIDGLGW